MIRRHSRSAIFMHWFNAICWIFLLFSGFALLTGDMQPIGRWWSSLWDGFFGGSRGLLLAHLAVGSVWVGGLRRVYPAALPGRSSSFSARGNDLPYEVRPHLVPQKGLLARPGTQAHP